MKIMASITSVPLDQQPCVVHLLKYHDRYLIGTYHLYPTTESFIEEHKSELSISELKPFLDKINNRSGKLIILSSHHKKKPDDSLVQYEYECLEGGGVFDAKVRYNKFDSSYEIYVAHANGTIGVYSLVFNCDSPTICHKEHLDVPGAKILTSIDIFQESQPFKQAWQSRFVVGDDSGFINVVDQIGRFVQENAGKSDPVWQVKSVELSTGKDIIIAATERNAWCIYEFDETAKGLKQVYENSNDFEGGVTSITVLEMNIATHYDLVNIALGSYDETIKTYSVKIYHGEGLDPHVDRKKTATVKGGGIWRLNQFNPENSRELAVAAMYAGTYKLTLGDSQDQSSGTLDVRLIESGQVKAELASDPLHYDVAMSPREETFCIADFNNSMCLVKTRAHADDPGR